MEQAQGIALPPMVGATLRIYPINIINTVRAIPCDCPFLETKML